MVTESCIQWDHATHHSHDDASWACSRMGWRWWKGCACLLVISQHLAEHIITHKGFRRELLGIPSLLFSPTSSWVKIVGHLQGIWYSFLASKSSWLLRAYPNRALKLCINCRHEQHDLLWLNTSFGQMMCPEVPSHPFPSRMTCTQILSQNTVEIPFPSPWDKNIRCGSSSKTELGSNQALHQALQIKVSLLQQPYKSHVPPRNYSGIKMASNKVSWMWSMKKIP